MVYKRLLTTGYSFSDTILPLFLLCTKYPVIIIPIEAMRPHLLKIPLKQDQSFNIRYDIVPHFYDQWHFHPEIELVYIVKGAGRQFIGNHVHHYKPGDLVLLGSGLPHLWKSDEQIVNQQHQAKVEAIVLHFMPDCLGPHFFELPEHKGIRRLLRRAMQAVSVTNATNRKVKGLMDNLLEAKAGARVVLLLQILNTLAGSRDLVTLGSATEYPVSTEGEADRLNAVYQYVLEHFTEEIALTTIAAVAHLSPNSFCRFFKSRVRKTFSAFLLEVRVAHAVRLLAETDRGVADICYNSGFNNLSNFNRYFRSITGTTPLAYRRLSKDP
jgi:AraC-like DNA-binding protein